jgi:hypothetical protein
LILSARIRLALSLAGSMVSKRCPVEYVAAFVLGTIRRIEVFDIEWIFIRYPQPKIVMKNDARREGIFFSMSLGIDPRRTRRARCCDLLPSPEMIDLATFRSSCESQR